MHKVSVPHHVTGSSNDAGLVLLDARNGIFYALNKPATVFWETLKATSEFECAVATVAGYWDQDPGVVLSELKILTEDLLALGLLQVA